jgi:hypothetical protein
MEMGLGPLMFTDSKLQTCLSLIKIRTVFTKYIFFYIEITIRMKDQKVAELRQLHHEALLFRGGKK